MSSELSLINEYAMSNGWDLNVFPKNTWTPAQNQRYNEWAKLAGNVDSNYSNVTEFAGTTYEPPQQTAWDQQTFQPGQNRVVTTNDQAGSVWGRRRRANTFDFGAGDEMSADELLAVMRATRQADTTADDAEAGWAVDDDRDDQFGEEEFEREQEPPEEMEPIIEESTKPITEQPDVFYEAAPLKW